MKKFETMTFDEELFKYFSQEDFVFRGKLMNHFKDWVSPEDHQAEIDKLNSKIDWLHGLLDERNEEVLQTVKLLNEAIPEIPKFVAEVVENHDLETLANWANLVPLLSTQVRSWLLSSDLVGHSYTYLLADLKINGYTVAKEKRYEVVFLEDDTTRQILMENNAGYYFIEEESENYGYWKQDFTEMEIKEINEKFWQLSVPVKDEQIEV